MLLYSARPAIAALSDVVVKISVWWQAQSNASRLSRHLYQVGPETVPDSCISREAAQQGALCSALMLRPLELASLNLSDSLPCALAPGAMPCQCFVWHTCPILVKGSQVLFNPVAVRAART